MKKNIILIVIFFCSIFTFSQSNLSSFEAKDDFGNIYSGYAEPNNESTSSTVKARIFIFPKIYTDKNSVIVRNKMGEKVNLLNYSNYDELTARVNIKLISNNPDSEGFLQIIAALNPQYTKPQSLKEKPILPILTGNNSMDAMNGQEFVAKERAWNDSRFLSIIAENNYQIIPVFPKNLKLDLLVNGNIVTTKILDESTVNPGSVFQLNIPFSKEQFNFKLLLDSDYLIQGEFTYLSSRFQSATAIQDLQTFVNYAANGFRKEISKASSSSSGFLFWKNIQNNIRTYIEEESRKNLNSGTVSKFEYKLYDVDDENLKNQVDDFLFPKITLEETINNHIQAAQIAMAKGDEYMAKIHNNYSEILKNNIASLADLKQIDVLGALTKLGANDIAGFLAAGVAFNESNSSGAFTYRKILSGSINQSNTKEFNALIIKSLFESHIITSQW